MRAIFAVIYREYKIRITNLMWLFFDVMMPFAYLLLFGLGLNTAFSTGIATGGTAVSYNAFFLPSVLAMAGFGIAMNTSYGIFVDRDNGIFYEFLTYPMTRGEFLIGKISFNCITSLLQAIVAILLGVALLDITILWGKLWMVFAGVIIGTAGWFFFLAIFALRIKRNDIFNTFINVTYFVLMFLSSIFYPLDGMPAWFRGVALLNPLTWQTDVLRHFLFGLGNPAAIGFEMIAFTLFLGVVFWLAVRALQRSA